MLLVVTYLMALLQNGLTFDMYPTESCPDYEVTSSLNLEELEMPELPDRHIMSINEQFEEQSAIFNCQYLITEWGCGTACQMNAIFNLVDGTVLDVLNSVDGIEFRPDSRLIIVDYYGDEEDYTYFLMEGNTLIELNYVEEIAYLEEYEEEYEEEYYEEEDDDEYLPYGYAQTGDIDSYEEIFIALNGGCSLGCGIGWDLEATSSLEPSGDNSYYPENMEDGKKETAWVEGMDDYGIGVRIVIVFEGLAEHIKIPFDGLQITNGYAKNDRIWLLNSRVKRLMVYLNDKPKLTIDLEDSIYPQFVRWDRDIIEVASGDIVELEIIDVYPGEKYSDTAISDLALFGGH